MVESFTDSTSFESYKNWNQFIESFNNRKNNILTRNPPPSLTEPYGVIVTADGKIMGGVKDAIAGYDVGILVDHKSYTVECTLGTTKCAFNNGPYVYAGDILHAFGVTSATIRAKVANTTSVELTYNFTFNLQYKGVADGEIWLVEADNKGGSRGM